MLVQCKVCKGRGFVTLPEWNINVGCPTCKGKGGFDVPDNKELCPDCNGKGKVAVPTDVKGVFTDVNCGKCFGTGFVDKL